MTNDVVKETEQIKRGVYDIMHEETAEASTAEIGRAWNDRRQYG